MREIMWKQNKIFRVAIVVFLLLTLLLSSVQAHAAGTDSLTIQTTVSGYSAMTQDGTAKVTLPDGTVLTAGGSALEDGLLFVIEPVTESDAADLYAWISSCLQGKGSDLMAYNIYFVDSNGNRCDAAGETTITISLSSDYGNPSVYRVATDGTATQMGTSVGNGVVSFVMGGNGYYALLESPEEDLSAKIIVQELTAVPDGLKNLYSSVDELISDLISRVVAAGTGYTADNTLVYDVVLQYGTDGGTTWITATVDNFPTTGITVTLPYPEGTDASYEFTVLHMFTETSSRLGITAGGTETPTITKTDDGLVVTLTGLSPVAIAWKAVTTSTTETDASATSASSTTGTQTGDNSRMVQWLVLLLVSGVAVSGISVYHTKRRRSR
ncbi:MAG: hypothetical protein LUE90_08385 [Clostridiales bacterium]|nr:hypothetical protein [Clostridiales bacterium]